MTSRIQSVVGLHHGRWKGCFQVLRSRPSRSSALSSSLGRKRPFTTSFEFGELPPRRRTNPSLVTTWHYIPSFYSRRFFHDSWILHHSGSTTNTTSTSSFDPLQYPSSAALLKPPPQSTSTVAVAGELFLSSPEEQDLKECLLEYQERPNDLDVLDALQQAYSALEYWEEALAVETHKCHQLRQRQHSSSSSSDSEEEEYANSIHIQGKLWLRQGNFEASRPLYEQALTYFQQRNNQVQEGHVLISLAGWHFFQHEVTHDPSSLETAMEYLIQAEGKLDSNPALLVKCLDNQGLICRLQGDYETALDKYQQALQVVVDEKTRQALQLHMADMHRALEEPQKALLLYQELLHEVQERSTTSRHSAGPKNDSLGMQGVLWHNIASIHVQMGQWEVAEEGFREALRLKEESAGREDHPELAKTWNALGAMYYGLLDEKQQAIECFRNVLWITRSHSAYDDPRMDPDVLAAIQTISDIEEQIDRERQGTKG